MSDLLVVWIFQATFDLFVIVWFVLVCFYGYPCLVLEMYKFIGTDVDGISQFLEY